MFLLCFSLFPILGLTCSCLTSILQMGSSRKNPNREQRVYDMEFPGVRMKRMWKFLAGVNKKDNWNFRHYCTFVPPPRVRVRATVKLSAAFFHDESSITIGGVRKCNSAEFSGVIIQDKIMWNFHGSWFLVFRFPRSVA